MAEGAFQVVLTKAHLRSSISDLRLQRSHYQPLPQAYQHAPRLLRPDMEGRRASYLRVSTLLHSRDFLHKARHHLQDLVHLQVKAHLPGCRLVSSSKDTQEQGDKFRLITVNRRKYPTGTSGRSTSDRTTTNAVKVSNSWPIVGHSVTIVAARETRIRRARQRGFVN